jgi:hypothetical protein
MVSGSAASKLSVISYETSGQEIRDLCQHDGNEASLILGKVYRVLPDARAAKDDLVRVVDESGEDYLFDKEQFVLVTFPQAASKRILALQKNQLTNVAADERDSHDAFPHVAILVSELAARAGQNG